MAEPLELSEPIPRVPAPSLKVTVPVGIPADTDFTAAVSVMDSLKLEGFLEEVRVVVEVALFTVWVS